MSEKHIPVHEHHEKATHLSSEQLLAQHEALEKHRSDEAERAAHASAKEKSVERAEQLAKNEAISSDEVHQPTIEKPKNETGLTREDKAHSFATTMHHVRNNLSAPERGFSKFIHQPAVEKTSEALGKTVARPSGVIGATVLACLGLLSIYSVAKFAGFELSGSEMPFLLAIGFVSGLIVEWAYKIIRTIFSPSRPN